MSPHQSPRRRLVVASFFITALVLFTITFLRGADVSAKDSSGADLYDELKVFTDVLAIVQRDYVRPVDNRKLVEGAIKGMLATLDPHSGYLDPDFTKIYKFRPRGSLAASELRSL